MTVQRTLFLASLLLCLGGSTAQEELVEDRSPINRFLSAARAEGLISEDQLPSFHDLAKRIGVLTATSCSCTPETSETGVFLMHFTLLNVLYLGGAVLIMGAYVLLVTVTMEKFDRAGLSVIMSVQAGLFGFMGVVFSRIDDYHFAGGLFCTICTGTVPFLVYNVQHALDKWPREDSYRTLLQGFGEYACTNRVIMEAATIATGLFFVLFIRFPLLLLPVSFCLLVLSLDLAPFYPDFGNRTETDKTEITRRYALCFGIGMIFAGFVFEKALGSDPDMGFWLYLFGSILFWTALNFDFPKHDISGSFYLLVQIGLIVMGSALNRFTLLAFGTLSVIGYLGGVAITWIKISPVMLLWILKAALAAVLFSRALRREGNMEMLGGLVCVLLFNIHYIRFQKLGEGYSVFLLVSNLGLVSTAAAFSWPISFWFFTLPRSGMIVSFVCSLLVFIYHFQMLKKFHYLEPPRSQIDYCYNGYYFVASILISFLFVSLRQSHFAWVGGLGIPLIAVNFSHVLRDVVLEDTERHRITRADTEIIQNSIVSFSLLLFGVVFSTLLRSDLLYLICCVLMLVIVLSHLDKWKIMGVVMSILLVLLSIPLQSTFFIAIGGIYLFIYLTHLAYNYFKNSLLFPLVLITLGLVLIFCGVQYQKYEQLFHDSFYSILPRPLTAFLTQTLASIWVEDGTYNFFSTLRDTSFSFTSLIFSPHSWILWPGALTFALSECPVTSVWFLAAVACILTAAILPYRKSLAGDGNNRVATSS